jgi:DedD protein
VKERLTGAIILVVLIVLLVPELLSGPSRPAATPAGAANSSEEPPLRSYTINLGEDSRTRAGAAGNGPAMPQPNPPEQPATAPSSSWDQPAQGEAPAAASATPGNDNPAALNSSAAPADSGTSVSNAASSTPYRSAAASDQASTSEQKSTAPATPGAKPEPAKQTRTAATDNAARTRTSSASSPPNNSSTASPANGWVVQLGVFASRENAERLATDVRVKGFKAFVSPITGSTRTLYRVRVGSASDRATAQELQGRLRAAGRPVGTVVPYS